MPGGVKPGAATHRAGSNEGRLGSRLSQKGLGPEEVDASERLKYSTKQVGLDLGAGSDGRRPLGTAR